MKIEIDDQVFKLFPGYIRYVLHVTNANNSEETPELLQYLEHEQAAVRADASCEDLKNHPRIASWRSAFERFGINPNQCPPSVASLIKRVRGGKELPYISSLVCIFNVISLRHILPAGGDDLDKVVGGIRLGIASGRERYIPLGSPDVAEQPKEGEMILCDTGNDVVFCRAWCWKNGHSSRIESTTRNVAVNIDVMPPFPEEEGISAAEEAAEMMRRFCGAKVVIHRLSADSPWIELS